MKYSESTEDLFAALSRFQGEIKNPKSASENPFFKSKYAKLEDILSEVRPSLAKNGLSIVQAPCSTEKGVGVVSIIAHESGEYIESDPYYLPLQKQDPQAGGSAITYARRYALAALLGIAQEDDDGNAASKNGNNEENKEHVPTFFCKVCGKGLSNKFAQKSKEKYGEFYCSDICLQKDKGDMVD